MFHIIWKWLVQTMQLFDLSNVLTVNLITFLKPPSSECQLPLKSGKKKKKKKEPTTQLNKKCRDRVGFDCLDLLYNC